MNVYGLLRRFLFAMDAEQAHGFTIGVLKKSPLPPPLVQPDPILSVRIAGMDFANPVGLAAGFDKNGEVVRPMLRIGFGFVEAGTVTLRPQPGNPQPRLFRLVEDKAVINRFGFNSAGVERVVARLEEARQWTIDGMIGINIGPNKDSGDPPADCATLLRRVAPLADFIVINVSSPNTPGLRAWQGGDSLKRMLDALMSARAQTENKPPLFCKIAPDLDADERSTIATAVVEAEIDGLIATNTTVARPESLKSIHRAEEGGLSGQPLLGPSTAILKDFYRRTEGRLPLIGVGGVSSGADAYARIRAGASLVELYTALVYEGPGLIGRILTELADLLRRDGFGSVMDAVGIDAQTEDALDLGPGA
jgi:dihydroorotate dehydrogenase